MVEELVDYEPRGAVRDLFYNRDSEILLEGPAGTGKTRGLCEYIYWLCITFPGIRVLMMRKTRASMTESVLVTWENLVLPNGQDEPCVTGTAGMANRASYTFPHARNVVNGVEYVGMTHVVLGGMDRPSRIMSTEYDVIAVFEGCELEEKEWGALLSRNRNWILPWQQAILDTNPDYRDHWANRRADRELVVPPELRGSLPEPRPGQKQMERLLSRHVDNPRIWTGTAYTPTGAGYMAKLHALPEPLKGRLLRGEWVTAEGQIWKEFDRARHMVHRQALDPQDKPAKDGHHRDDAGHLKCDWYFGSVDWGWRNPGVLQIWGVQGQFERMYRVHEVFRPGMQRDWWAEAVVAYDKKYELQALVCDPSDPASIANMNQRIGESRGRSMAYMTRAAVAKKADNNVVVGLDMVRYGLDPGASLLRHDRSGDLGVRIAPKLFLCWDALEEADPALLEDKRPTCTEQEIPAYTWKTTEDGQAIKDEPNKRCSDHGCDAMRYAATFAWGKDLTPPQTKTTFPEGSMGDVLGHDDVAFE